MGDLGDLDDEADSGERGDAVVKLAEEAVMGELWHRSVWLCWTARLEARWAGLSSDWCHRTAIHASGIGRGTVGP